MSGTPEKGAAAGAGAQDPSPKSASGIPMADEGDLPPSVKQIFASLPPDAKGELVSFFQTEIQVGRGYSSSEVKAFEALYPGFAKKYLENVLSETPFRQQCVKQEYELDAFEVKSGDKRVRLGLRYGFCACLAVLLLAAYALHLGHPATAGAIVAVDIVGLAACFVYGSRSDGKGQNEKPSSEAAQQRENDADGREKVALSD